MLLLALLYFYTIVSVFLLYVLLMGQTNFHRNGIIGKLNTCITTLPKTCMGAVVRAICGQKGLSFCSRLEKYLCFQRNPLLQVVYLSLMGANSFLYFITLFKMIPNILVPGYHQAISIIILLVAYMSYWKACFANPGNVEPETVDKFANSFENDGVMYFPDRKCHTCGIIKPPRSKHCVVTNKCVARFDHFCGWLNNDVGELNYRWFHLFLIANFVACFYGVYIYLMSLFSVIISEDLLNAVFMTSDGHRVKANLAIVLQYMISSYLLPIAQTFFMLAIGLMLFGFWAYHLYLAGRNKTTNETFKWEDIEKLHRIVKAYRGNQSNNPDDMKTLYHRIYDEKEDEKEQEENAKDNKNSNNKKNANKSSHNKRKEIEKEWRLKQLIAINENVKKGNSSIKNPYNKGFFNNIKEVMFPPALYKKSKFN